MKRKIRVENVYDVKFFAREKTLHLFRKEEGDIFERRICAENEDQIVPILEGRPYNFEHIRIKKIKCIGQIECDY